MKLGVQSYGMKRHVYAIGFVVVIFPRRGLAGMPLNEVAELISESGELWAAVRNGPFSIIAVPPHFMLGHVPWWRCELAMAARLPSPPSRE